MARQKLDGLLLAKVKKACKIHGLMAPIVKDTGCDRRTLRNIVKNDGWADETIITRILFHFNKGKSSAEDPLKIVCEHFELESESLLQKRNFEARQIAAYLLVRMPKTTFKQVADRLHYSNDSAVQWAVNTIANRMDVETPLRRTVLNLQAKAGL